LPTTYPVQGKVVYQDGKPVQGGSIWFQPEENAHVSTSGEIQPDGTFTLSSSMAGGHAQGAIAGSYRVTVTIDLAKSSVKGSAGSSSESAASPPMARRVLPQLVSVMLPETYTVTAGDNNFNLKIRHP
jgi:hypothetical protein